MPDPGWVRIYHPDQLDDPDVLPDPDDPEGLDNDKFATVTEEAYNDAWARRGWKNLDEDRATSLTTDEVVVDQPTVPQDQTPEPASEPGPRSRSRKEA